MQVQEVSASGLKRQFKVTVPAADIESRVTTRLQKLGQTVKVAGFRPGKVPLALLRRQYGRSVMGEVLEQAVDEGSKKAIGDAGLRPALQPKIDLQVFDEGKDLEFAIDVELLPDVPAVDLAAISLTRPVVTVDEEQVDRALERLATSRQRFEPVDPPRPAAAGDRLTIDFEGRIGGQLFEGGKGEGMPLVLGSGMMVPGFENQLMGAEPGEQRTVEVTFPDGYQREDLSGRAASFAVTVKAVEAPLPTVIDDAFAAEVGMADLAAVRQAVRERLVQEFTSIARQRLKRQLLDQLAEGVRFEVPAGMVDLEFDGIWKQLQEEMKRGGQSFATGDAAGPAATADDASAGQSTTAGDDGAAETTRDAGAEPAGAGGSEAEARAEYRSIAERRVRLGLVLSDIGVKNGVRVENQELQQAVSREAMRFKGQERQVFEFYRANPGALENLRAPVFEDKVVDYLLTQVRVDDRPVSVDQLVQETEADGELPAEAQASEPAMAALPAGAADPA